MNLLDRFICYFAPAYGQQRLAARATLQQIANLTGISNGPYTAAKLSRLGSPHRQVVKENEVSTAQIDRLREQSWNLYRNNPSARKVVRSLIAKVIGRGLHPECQAIQDNGTPATQFRQRAAQLWKDIQNGFDSRGVPGRGGQTLVGLQKLALKSVILSGETLYRVRAIDPNRQAKLGTPLPIALQLIDAARLADESEILRSDVTVGNQIYRGIELDGNDERVAYWIRNLSVTASAASTGKAVRVPADKIGHLFIEDDIDQLRGVPWFAPAIIGIRDTGDLQYNVLKATAMAACVIGSYSKPTGATKLGLNQSATSSTSADGTDLTDSDGNTITKFQPGMLLNVGRDGKFDLHSPTQPNMNPEGFVQHLQRGTATAFPGVKASTITGDYRNSSFSSERSADNDTWPELHDVQDWFAESFCQPLWESILRAGVMAGYFDGIVTSAEFQANPSRYCAAAWRGPIALSINPRDDAEAAKARISAGISDPQQEAAKVGNNWRDVVSNVAEFYAYCREKHIPEAWANNVLGVDTSDQIAATVAATQAQPADQVTQETVNA